MTDNADEPSSLGKFELIPEDRELVKFSFRLKESNVSAAPSDAPCPACLAPLDPESETLSCSQDHLSVHKECADSVTFCPYPGCGGELLEEFPLATSTPVSSAPGLVSSPQIASYRCPACFDDVLPVDSVASCQGRHFYVHLDCLELLSDCPAVGCSEQLVQVEKLERAKDDVIRLSSADVRSVALVNERLQRRQQRRQRLARLREPLIQQRAARRARQIIAEAETKERYRRFQATILGHKKKLGALAALLFSLAVAIYNPSFLPTDFRIQLAGFFHNKEVLLEITQEESGLKKARAISALSFMTDLSRREVAVVCLSTEDPSPVVAATLSDFIAKHRVVAVSEIVKKICRTPSGQARALEFLEPHKSEASRAILEAMHSPTIYFDRRAMTAVLIEFQPESIPILIGQLRRKETFYNEQVVEILREMGINAEADLLLALQSKDPQVRKYVLRCLRINSRTSQPIRAALHDSNEEVKREADRCLKRANRE